jgi:plastocyanin
VRPAGAALAVWLVVSCGSPAAVESTPWPGQALGEHTVTLVRPTIGPSPTVPVGTAVSIRGSFFNPPYMEVPLGSVVTWMSHDTARHTITSGVRERGDGDFDREIFANGTFSFAFLVPGIYHYHCRLHGSMNATLVVR